MFKRLCRECGSKFHPPTRAAVVCEDCQAVPADPDAEQRLKDRQAACGHAVDGWLEDPRGGVFQCGACGLAMDLHFEQEGWADRVKELVAAREKLRRAEPIGAKHG